MTLKNHLLNRGALLLSLIGCTQILSAKPEAWLLEMPEKHGTHLLKLAQDEDRAPFDTLLKKLPQFFGKDGIKELAKASMAAPEELVDGLGTSYLAFHGRSAARELKISRKPEEESIRIKTAINLGQNWTPTFAATINGRVTILFERDPEAEAAVYKAPEKLSVKSGKPARGAITWWTEPSAKARSGSMDLLYHRTTIPNAGKFKNALSLGVKYQIFNRSAPYYAIMLEYASPSGKGHNISQANGEISHKEGQVEGPWVTKFQQQQDLDHYEVKKLESPGNWTVSIETFVEE